MNPLIKKLRLTKIPIFTLLTIPFLMEITLAVGVVGFISYRNGQNAVENVVKQLHDEISSRVEQRINIYLINPHLINQINADAYNLKRLALNETDELERYFWKQLKSFRSAELSNSINLDDNQKSINSIYFSNEKGQLFGAEYNVAEDRIDVSRSDLERGFLTYPADSEGRPDWGNPRRQEEDGKEYDPRIRPWYEAAKDFGKAWSEIYLDISSDSPAITAALAIRDQENKLIGVLASDLLLSEVSEFMNDLQIGETGEAFIFDVDQETQIDQETGGWEIVITSKPEKNPYDIVEISVDEKVQKRLQRKLAIESENPLIAETSQYLKNQSGGDISRINLSEILSFRLNGSTYFVKVTPIQDDYDLKWYIVTIIPKSDFMTQIYRNNFRTIILCIIALGIATAVSLYTSFRISRPIRLLTKSAQELQNLEQISLINKVEIEKIENPAELAILAKTFEKMVAHLTDIFNDLERTSVAYERFVPKKFLSLLNTENITEVKLGDSFEAKEGMTILFSDIRSFTNLSESMNPAENFKFVNSYFGVMAPKIRENMGFIDKYIGDAIMALFDGEKNADHAVKAGIEMQKSLDLWNRKNRGGKNRPYIRTGIGIHTGQLILGTVGAEKRMDSTVIGKEVNRASRLEGLTKDYGARILISGETLNALEHRSDYRFRFFGKAKVKGVIELLDVYEVLNGDELEEKKIQSKEYFEAAVRLFDAAYELQIQGEESQAKELYSQSRESFEKAKEIFPADIAVNFFIERCEARIS